MSAYKKEISRKEYYINVLIGAASGTAVTLVALLVLAAVMLFFNVNTSFASPLSSVALAVGSLAGAYISAYKNKSKGFMCGLLNAAVIFVIIAIVGFVLSRDITVMSFIHFAVTVLASLIGGILGVNKADKIKVV